MTVENKQYLGWGLLGTPKGRQQLPEGVSKQLDSARFYDLDQEFGACLPNPLKDTEGLPLYCVSLKQIGKNNAFGVSEYRTVFEQGQTRSGTFFGAFVESASCIFNNDENVLKNILSALYELSKYQYEHFIDRNTQSYKESLIGKTFVSPDVQLNEVAKGLKAFPTNYFNQTLQSGVLYLQYRPNTEIEVLKMILEYQLYNHFQKIFFSASEYISDQMKNKKVAFYNAEQLKGSKLFMEPALKQVQSCQNAIKQKDEKIHHLQSELRNTQTHQAQIIEQNVRQQAEGYIQQAQQYKQEAEQARQQMTVFKDYAEYGKSVLQTAVENAEKLGKPEIARLIPTPTNEQNKKLQSIENRLATISHQLDSFNKEETVVEPAPQSSNFAVFLAWAFGITSLVMCLGAIGWAIFSEPTVSQEAHQKVEQTLKNTQNSLEELEKSSDNSQLKKDKEKLEKEKADLDAKYKKLEQCINDYKNKKAKELTCLDK